MKQWLSHDGATWLCFPRCGSQSVMAALAARSGDIRKSADAWSSYIQPTWVDWWCHGGTLPAGPLYLVVREPLHRFISALRIWSLLYPHETSIDRILDQAALGSTEAHIAQVSRTVSGLLKGREADITYLKLEEIHVWAPAHRLSIPHLNGGGGINPLSPAQIARVKKIYAADYQLLNYESKNKP